jgi:hypothetical protein
MTNETTRRTDGEAIVGDVLTYEDVANPRSTFIVQAIVENRWGREYRLLNLDTDETSYCACRGFGWVTHRNWRRDAGLI